MAVDINNLAIHFEYSDPEKVQVGNGSCLSISHIDYNTPSLHDSLYSLSNILYVPTISQNLLSVNYFTDDNNVSIKIFLDYFYIKDLLMGTVLHKSPKYTRTLSIALVF